MAERVEHLVIGLGALGSAATWQLARAGHAVVGLERFDLGHERGASHDSSRILRHSYHTPAYVGLSRHAYADWAELEAATGEQLVTPVGGLDLFPPDAAIPTADYTTSLEACGIAYEVLDAHEVRTRWPVMDPGDGTRALFQADAAIVPAARGTAAMQRAARACGAVLRERSPVTGLRDLGAQGVEVRTDAVTYLARRVVVCADAWTGDLLAGVGHRLPLTVTLEQVTYFAPDRPESFGPGRLPLWIWMDDPAWYGFPTYGEPTVKAAEDCGGPVVSGDDRSFEPDPERERRLARFVQRLLPGVEEAVRSKTCLYTLTPDRDFVLDAVPGHEAVLVGLGAAHGFKFAPTLGRLLAELAVTGSTTVDRYPFRLDRPGLTEADRPVSWLV